MITYLIESFNNFFINQKININNNVINKKKSSFKKPDAYKNINSSQMIFK